MIVGIKYCGGCQNRYNRTEFVEAVKDANPDLQFRVVNEDAVVDYLLVINGCTAACADISHIIARKGHFMVTGRHMINRVQAELDRLKLEEAEEMKRRRVINIGDEASFHKTLSEADVQAFAGVTADFSRMHVDEIFAKESDFGKRIVHGMLLLSYVSTVMGMQLPGDGTIFMGQRMRFLKPAYLGDTVTATVKAKSVLENEDDYILTLEGTVKNDKDEVLLKGMFDQMLPKRYFVVNEKAQDRPC